MVKNAVALYREAAPVIREGRSRRVGMPQVTYRKLEGWQAVVRSGTGSARGLALIVVHIFSHPEREYAIDLPDDCASIIGALCPPSLEVRVQRGRIIVSGASRETGAAILVGPDPRKRS